MICPVDEFFFRCIGGVSMSCLLEKLYIFLFLPEIENIKHDSNINILNSRIHCSTQRWAFITYGIHVRSINLCIMLSLLLHFLQIHRKSILFLYY